jgi:hypothetical protein
MPRCAVEEPPDVRLVDGSVTRCWLVGDSAEGTHGHATA